MNKENQTRRVLIGGKNKSLLLEDLSAYCSFISPWAMDLLNRIEVPGGQPQRVNFKRLLIEDLGLERSESEGNLITEELIDRSFLSKMGLSFCEPSDIFHLPFDFRPEDTYESAYLMHQPMIDSFKCPSILSFVREDSGMRIDSRKAYGDSKWSNKNPKGKKRQFLIFRSMG